MPADHRFEVGVVEHEDRRLATELQVGALERPGRRLEHLLAGGDAAGQRDHAHAGWLISGAPTVSPRPVTMLTTPGREDLGQKLGRA